MPHEDGDSHFGADPGHGGITTHRGRRSDCPAPDCLDHLEEATDAMAASAVARLDAVLRSDSGYRVDVGHSSEGGDCFTAVLWYCPPGNEDVLEPGPGDSCVAVGQAPTLAEALAKLASHTTTGRRS